MRPQLLLSLLSWAVLQCGAQTPVEVSFQTDPVQVQTGSTILLTVITVPSVFSMTWQYQGQTLGVWTEGVPSLQPVPQFQGRISVLSTKLQIVSAELRDAGQYMVEVDPLASTGLGTNTNFVTVNVFDAVTGVNLFVPAVAVETRNISLTCTYQMGSEVTFLWTKDGAALTASARITITGGSLVINPGERGDAGDYTCTVSNPVSARQATQTLTVYYGPDTPVLTKDTVKECVGAGDVWVDRTVTLTCTSTSLPLAQFSWQFDGQAISSPDTGVLSLQPSSTDQSGTYTCTARNSVTGLSSEQSTDLVVTDVCLDVGEVVGVVIGSFILLILLIILIILIVRCVLVRRRRREANAVQTEQKNDANPQPRPQNPPANVGRSFAQGPQPPLYHATAEPRRAGHLYTAPLPGRGRRNDSSTSRHNGALLANGLPRNNAIQSTNNGFDNPAFEAPQQMQSPGIVIQTGGAQVSLNTLQRTPRQNNAPVPTIHVNLNSHSADQPQQQVPEGPAPAAGVNESTQTPQTVRRAAGSTLRTPMLDRHRAILQAEPGQIPTGYSHHNRNFVNAEFEMYNQRSEPRSRSESSFTEPTPPRQLPWDTLRGTPAYPNNQRRGESDSTDYTTHPPIRARSRSRERQEAPRESRERQEAPRERDNQRSRSRERQEAPRERDNRRPGRETSSHTQRSAPRDDMRGGGESRGPRQDVGRDNSPQALPLMSQTSPAGRPPAHQQQQQPDSRALADPNHLQQPLVRGTNQILVPTFRQTNEMTVPTASQHFMQTPQWNDIPSQTDSRVPQPTPTQQASHPTNQVPQRNVEAVRQPARPQSQLTQEALQVHTERAQTFQNRRQQTQAALLHPGTQTRNNRAPTPPPVIALDEFQALPRERTRPRDARPPVNMPVAQRPHHAHHRQHATNHHHHHHQNGHAQGAHRQHAHTGQQQAHRGRPR